MKCPKCDASISKDDLFCPECGHKIVKKKEETGKTANSKEGHKSRKWLFWAVPASVLILALVIFVPTKTISYTVTVPFETQETYTAKEPGWESQQLLTSFTNQKFSFYKKLDSKGSGYIDCVAMTEFQVPKKARLAYELTTTPSVPTFFQIISSEDCRSRKANYEGNPVAVTYHPLLATAQTDGLDYGYYCALVIASERIYTAETCGALSYGLKIFAQLYKKNEVTKTRTVTKEREETRYKKVNWIFG